VVLCAIADDLRRYSEAELVTAARPIRAATDALYDDVFFVPLD
jgi:hypothetical protein